MPLSVSSVPEKWGRQGAASWPAAGPGMAAAHGAGIATGPSALVEGDIEPSHPDGDAKMLCSLLWKMSSTRNDGGCGGAGGWQPLPPPCCCGGLSRGTFFPLLLLVALRSRRGDEAAEGWGLSSLLGTGAAVRCPATFPLLFLFCFFLQLPSTNLKPPNPSTPRSLLRSHVAGCNLCGGAGLGLAGAL